jgi:chromosome segregation ATPase
MVSVLYLAEVLRKARVIGGGRAELKLLACQRSELSWSAVPGEEVIPAPDDVNYNAGALVMVELSAGKQVQRHAEAGRQLVSILQNFSRLQEKAKTQEEEIEQWKQSLTYQSQELNRREMEIEAAQEQLQQMDEDFERLEKQRQEIETAQEEVNRLRAEFERKSQELEGAWAQLQGESNRLEERQAELQQMTVLDEGQSRQFQELLDRVANSAAPIESIQAQLQGASESLTQQQQMLDQHWQKLGDQQTSAQQLQEEVNRQTQILQERWSAWQQAQTALEQTRIELEIRQNQLHLKQESAKTLAAQLQNQETLYQEVAQLADGAVRVNLSHLEQMPLEELQTTTQDLEKDLEKLSRFVSSQEEELVLQQQTIDELRDQIQQASEYDRLRLETELADEQDRYQMLNETLVGQRRNLQERQITLKQHQTVLAKRQGYPLPNNQERSIDVEPILNQIEQSRQQCAEQLRAVEQEIQDLQTAIAAAQQTVAQQAGSQDANWNELRQADQQMRSQIATVAELWGKVNTYQEFLQPIQDNLNRLKQQTEGATATIAGFQQSSTAQHQAIAEMRETVQQLTNPTAELAAS